MVKVYDIILKAHDTRIKYEEYRKEFFTKSILEFISVFSLFWIVNRLFGDDKFSGYVLLSSLACFLHRISNLVSLENGDKIIRKYRRYRATMKMNGNELWQDLKYDYNLIEPPEIPGH